MNSMVLLFVLGAITYFTRIAGFALSSLVSGDVAAKQAILDRLATCIIACLLASILWRADMAVLAGTVAAASLLLVVRSPILAMIVAVAITAIWRACVGAPLT